VGALVVEYAELLPRGRAEREHVRLSGGLCLREGSHQAMLPLLCHLFASGQAPDVQSARVEFLLNGAAYQWQCEFTLGSEELINRTSGSRLVGRAAIEAHLVAQMQAGAHSRAAAFITPPPNVSGPQGLPANAHPPASDALASDLVAYEASLARALGAQDTATALYADLFPLLEAQEEASLKLSVKVKQLERHYQAEAAVTAFRRLESEIQERLAAARQARQVEKQIAEYEKEREHLVFIDEALLARCENQQEQVESARQAFIEAEKARKQAQARLSTLRPRRWWIATAAAVPVLVAPALLPLPYAEYVWGLGVLLMTSLPVAASTSLRRRSTLRAIADSKTSTANCRRDLELAELSYRQMLKPFGARDTKHLRQKAEEQVAWQARLDQATEELAHLRKISGTDDTLSMHSARESSELAELEQRCRELAPYRLSESDRLNVEQMVQELEGEARCQQEAALEIRAQCEQLTAGWSDLPLLSERVAGLRLKLAEWKRWEDAFRQLHLAVNRLPDVPDLPAPGPEARASAYLARLTAGRWTRLHCDPAASAFKLYDEQSALWIRADRENPAIRSTVDLAYRLCLLEDESLSMRLPLWILEPFEELPETMSTACAALLAEVAQRRQVVLLCRQLPKVRWPEGVGLESR
jgi:hypothetical protein